MRQVQRFKSSLFILAHLEAILDNLSDFQVSQQVINLALNLDKPTLNRLQLVFQYR